MVQPMKNLSQNKAELRYCDCELHFYQSYQYLNPGSSVTDPLRDDAELCPAGRRQLKFGNEIHVL